MRRARPASPRRSCAAARSSPSSRTAASVADRCPELPFIAASMPRCWPASRSASSSVCSAPETGAAMRPLGDGFIKLIRMLIGADRLHHDRRRHRADGRDEGGRPHRPAGRSSTSRSSPRSRWSSAWWWSTCCSRASASTSPPAPPTSRPPPATAPRGDAAPEHRRLPPQHHPDHGRRRVRARRHPAGAAGRRCSPGIALLTLGDRARPLVGVIDQSRTAVFAIVGLDHAAGADRRVRRDGVHRRPLRHRLAGLARHS